MAERMRDLLVAVADEIDPGAPPAELLARARRRAAVHRGGQLAGVFALVLLAVGLPVGLLHHRTSTPVTAPTSPPPPAPIPVATSDAARISTWRWSSLPTAPIADRIDEAYAWTGREMLVWGGATPDGEQPYDDGAAYDPAARTWRELPASPLTARSGPAYAWTGSKLFVWGGFAVDGSRSDGALYDPANRTWQTLPPAPISARRYANAVWTGRYVLVIGGIGPPGGRYQSRDVAAYDPVANRWLPRPDLPEASGRDVVLLTATATDDGTVYALAYWQSSSGNSIGSGIDPLVLPPGAAGWTRLARPPSLAASPPLWTGRYLIVPGGATYYGNHRGPYLVSGDYRFDPAAGTWTALPDGPADKLGGTSVWTGAAMVTLDTRVEISGGAHDIRPGQAAAYDPAANRWTRLPAASRAGASAIVYTGDSILLWGPSLALALGP